MSVIRKGGNEHLQLMNPRPRRRGTLRPLPTGALMNNRPGSLEAAVKAAPAQGYQGDICFQEEMWIFGEWLQNKPQTQALCKLCKFLFIYIIGNNWEL